MFCILLVMVITEILFRKISVDLRLSSSNLTLSDWNPVCHPLSNLIARDTDFRINKVIGLLSSTVQAVLPARLQFRYLQQQQIQSLKAQKSYQHTLILNKQSKEELIWWVNNLNLSNGRYLVQPLAQVVIQTDASMKGWGALCKGISTGGLWPKKEH